MLWETSSALLTTAEAPRWHYVVAVEPSADLTLTVADLGETSAHAFVVYDYFTQQLHSTLLTNTSEASITATYNSGHNTSLPMEYLIVAPVLPRSGWALLGQVGAFVQALTWFLRV